MNDNQSIRLRTTPGIDKNIIVKLDQEFDTLDVLSLKIRQEDVYSPLCANYGIVVGRVIANKGLGIPNAKVSIFVPISEEDKERDDLLQIYPYETVNDTDEEGRRYNVLPNTNENMCHQAVGTFPRKSQVLDNDIILEVYEKYYKYTTRTNDAGDYMIVGVPTGNQQLHVDVDLSDIEFLSMKPHDFIAQGFSPSQFQSNTQFKYSADLDTLSQLEVFNKGVDVVPFWGNEDTCEVGITRADFKLSRTLTPNAIFFGSIFGDDDKNSVSKNCRPKDNLGAICNMTTGEGTIEIMKRQLNGSIIEQSVDGGRVIDENGNWAFPIPMNLKPQITDEFGNLVDSDDAEVGVFSEADVRFRIGIDTSGSEGRLRSRGKYLVPNMHNNYYFEELSGSDPQFKEKYPLQNEIGQEVVTGNGDDHTDIDNKFADFFTFRWKKLYTVRNFIPRYQKRTLDNNKNFIGIKDVDSCGAETTPFPFNRTDDDFSIIFLIICQIITLIGGVLGFVNRLIIGVNSIIQGLNNLLEGLFNLGIQIPCNISIDAGPVLNIHENKCRYDVFVFEKDTTVNTNGNIVTHAAGSSFEAPGGLTVNLPDTCGLSPNPTCGRLDIQPITYHLPGMSIIIDCDNTNGRCGYSDQAGGTSSDTGDDCCDGIKLPISLTEIGCVKIVIETKKVCFLSDAGTNAGCTDCKGSGGCGDPDKSCGCNCELLSKNPLIRVPCTDSEGDVTEYVPLLGGSVNNPENALTTEDENYYDSFPERFEVDSFVDCILTRFSDRVISFEFYNDWVNGSLYAPLFKYKVKKKRRGKKVTDIEKEDVLTASVGSTIGFGVGNILAPGIGGQLGRIIGARLTMNSGNNVVKEYEKFCDFDCNDEFTIEDTPTKQLSHEVDGHVKNKCNDTINRMERRPYTNSLPLDFCTDGAECVVHKNASGVGIGEWGLSEKKNKEIYEGMVKEFDDELYYPSHIHMGVKSFNSFWGGTPSTKMDILFATNITEVGSTTLVDEDNENDPGSAPFLVLDLTPTSYNKVDIRSYIDISCFGVKSLVTNTVMKTSQLGVETIDEDDSGTTLNQTQTTFDSNTDVREYFCERFTTHLNPTNTYSFTNQNVTLLGFDITDQVSDDNIIVPRDVCGSAYNDTMVGNDRETPYYFYFGINQGKTALEKLRNEFFDTCVS